MVNIMPAVLASTWLEIETKIKQVESQSPWIHLDVADGDFVPVTTWNTPDDLSLLPGRIMAEVHLMVEKPEEVLPNWVWVADRIIVQVESTDVLADMVTTMKGAQSKLALSLLVDTPLEEVLPYLEAVEMIQLMGIKKVGFQGEKFDSAVLDKIATLKSRWPTGVIQLDGGVNLATAPDIIKAGAASLVVGSALWHSGDIVGTLEGFKKL
ncbi:MAG: hypothetical protein A2589_02140 [Candidatus Vogelbacteria bacterium RIFOXYD1_FULL_46_19]|uniref:Ribulose-phosphate 3-epimerase n=1 Tax=Candidatus Vogelbacteria bacterium RIFOXYD1_FULL_46_19 TaxID=1802439 RepID=A0A1G2QGL0_9BACT|nr:MAG: hypothetical protein A2589_02140 [Candidatus Vogelbacteria bacterium RIFOXYD1_FULL_46_19]